ncbi:nuclear transport factor 2 family protein [Rhizobium jaguaris]|uniref:Nuclear transport factor 2 family protein n=1 Tax=Rhizobium jaguaris TaxID=1312183 RepID=A0A387FWJ2_9HYPH|nr:nuclear transport factor 2 family protein [Rhizobium jaguaris]AYG59882.1 nuclear transport factor 2 family protein [Rhizobium jaguaris]
MTISLPEKLAAYFAAVNKRDVAGMLAQFGEDAFVHDEGEEMRGHAAIRSWIVKTTGKYGITADIQGVDAIGQALRVSAQVAGTFPGSPIVLHYDFTLGADGEIIRLEIGL